MHHAELSARMTEAARKIAEMKEKHPELWNELAPIEGLLIPDTEVKQSHPPTQPPYRKAY